jgi:transmembrane sensor
LNKNKKIARLIYKHLKDELSEEELKELAEWLAHAPENLALYDRLIKNFEMEQQAAPPQKRLPFFKLVSLTVFPVSIAACAIFVLKLCHYSQNRTLDFNNKVTIRLADGTYISPDTVKDCLLINQGDCQLIIHKKDVRYSTNNNNKRKRIKHDIINEISTPVGKQFTVVLPDESRIYLNAFSSLSFPVSSGLGTRNVEFTGEGYFIVKKVYNGNIKAPFVVKVKTHFGLSQEVTVMGTAFNINAYGDEPEIKTTLVEGKVNVACGGKNVLLFPGEELHIRESFSHTLRTNTEDAIAWKDEEFFFRKVPVAEAMKELGRWYDLKVAFSGDTADRITYVGPRSKSIKFVMDGICAAIPYEWKIIKNQLLMIKKRDNKQVH